MDSSGILHYSINCYEIDCDLNQTRQQSLFTAIQGSLLSVWSTEVSSLHSAYRWKVYSVPHKSNGWLNWFWAGKIPRSRLRHEFSVFYGWEIPKGFIVINITEYSWTNLFLALSYNLSQEFHHTIMNVLHYLYSK